MTEIVEMYTDGACRGNPGKGGWGVLLRYGDVDKTIYGGELMSTNNRMEMTAVIKGLEALTRASHVLITTDSKYVLKGMTEWLSNWKARNWRTASKKPVQNVELWKQLDVLVSQHSVEWSWVKGHSGHTENEIADQLANLGIDELIE
ncbi:MAG: ribonuclease HI [Gammaproteobacteria bacterium]|jgi:ribonuclease HI|nr:ribonuclease HI [Gammaproteobacteria bacterium]|tara:strand:- start:647 stop:1087 length:441 start_codon:yes stop_codon:yes gene_type:complete